MPQELGQRELSIVLNLHEGKFLNLYSYLKEMTSGCETLLPVF